MDARPASAAVLCATDAASPFLSVASCRSSSAIFSVTPGLMRSTSTAARTLAAAVARFLFVSVTVITTMLTTDVEVLTVEDGVSTVVSLRSVPALIFMLVLSAASLSSAWLASTWVAALAFELRPAIGLPLASVVWPMYTEDVALYSLGEARVTTPPTTAPRTTSPRMIHQLRSSVANQKPASMAVASSVLMRASGIRSCPHPIAGGGRCAAAARHHRGPRRRSEEHTSEL